MSMRDYSAEGYGIIFTEEMLDMIEKRFSINGNIAENIGLEELFSFTGEAISVDENGSDDWSAERMYFENEYVYYAPLKSCSTLTKAAYPSMKFAADELKKYYGRYLPKDFDYLHSIKHIIGTYYG